MAYSDKVIDHYENPRNVGSFDKDDDGVGTGIVGAPACGDVMKLQIKVENGVIQDAKFKTYGCVVSNTKVNTPGGIRRVCELNENDDVLAWNGNTIVVNTIKSITKHVVDQDDLLVVTLARETSRNGVTARPHKLITTKDHIFFNAAQKVVEAQSLKPGDELFEITEFELRQLTNVRRRKDLRVKLSKRMKEFNKQFDHSTLPQNKKGYVHSATFKKKISQAIQMKWQDERYVSNWRYGMSKIDWTKPTSIEREFMRFFKAHDIPVKYSAGKVWIQTKYGPRSPDFIVPGKKRVIEVYTKNLPLCMENRSSTSDYVDRKHAEYANAGFEVLCLAVEDISSCLQDVQAFVHNGMKVLSVDSIKHGNELRGCERSGRGVVVYDIALNEGANVMFYNRAASHNCGSAIASSSLVTEWVKGMSVDDAMKIENSQIAEELSLPPVKIHCSVLAEDAIKAAIADYQKKQCTD